MVKICLQIKKKENLLSYCVRAKWISLPHVFVINHWFSILITHVHVYCHFSQAGTCILHNHTYVGWNFEVYSSFLCHRILIQITKRVQYCTFIIYVIKRIMSYYASSEFGLNSACNVVKNKYHWFLFFEPKIWTCCHGLLRIHNIER